jgi:branched-chain amino acid transport system ATP-binding protein
MTFSLETRDLTVTFGGHVAVNGVSCGFRHGTLTSIVGPNGAGKTTYFNLISGQLKATRGHVFLHGEDISDLAPSARSLRGVGRAFQLTNLFPHLSALENVRLAVQSRAALGFNLHSVWSSHRELLSRAEAVLDIVALADKRHVEASALAHGDQRKLDVAMLLALEPDVFMLDEPTAGMSPHDMPVMLDLIHSLKTRKEKTLLLVEHKMDVIRELSDRIIVMHNGALVADGEPADVIASPIVREAYLGVEFKA